MARTRKKHQKEDEPVEAPAEGEETLETLRAERDDYLEKWRRAAADYQNMRRRALADSEERLKRSMQPLLESMLTVLDYLDMALACPTTNDESKNLAVGVRLTRDHFLQILEREEVSPIPPADTFDPALHEAKSAMVRDDLPEGTIIETVRTGYTLRGEVLRFAHVVVAKPDREEPAEEVVEGPADAEETTTDES